MSLSRFYRHTATYTVGNFIYRGAAFFLVPLYAHALPPSEYGRLELIMLTAFLFQSVFSAGVAHSALRFYFEYDKEEERRAVISTALVGSFLFTLLGASILIIGAPTLSSLVFKTPAYAAAFRLVAISLVIDVSREINLAYIRALERSGLFIAIALVQLVVQVGVTVLGVVFLHMGIYGVLTGNLVAALAVWAILVTFAVRTCGLHLHRPTLIAIVKYGGPLTLSGLVGAAFQSMDRWALNSYATLEVLGLYALALRVVNIIPMLVVTPFTNSYGSYRFSIMKEPGATKIYARVQTYYLFVAAFVVLAIGSTSRELLRIVAAPEYWTAAAVVPLLLIPAGLSGVDYCFQTGIYIVKKTKYMFYGSLMTGLVNVGLIVFLVPRFGVFGAALAGVGASLYGVTQTSIISRVLYPMRYEFGRMFRIILAAAVLEVFALSLTFDNAWHGLFVKAIIVAFFPVVVGLLRVYTPDERQKARDLWLQLTTRLQLRHAV
jgi:O-antigen/teichoic acid export membrane protein